MMRADRRYRGWCWLAAGLLAAPVADVEAANDDGGRALIAAVRAQDAGASRALIDRGAAVDAVQPDGATALHWAAYHDAVGLGRPADRGRCRRRRGERLWRDAAGSGVRQRRRGDGGPSCWRRGPTPNRARGSGETPVMTCARTGSAEAVRALLAHGADPSAVEPWHGQTALMWAAGGGHGDAARALIEHGADVGARSRGGFAALLIAAREDDPALVGDLIAAGADVNAAAPDGTTPLHVAVVRGHAGLAMALLEHGADPNADGPGYTALHWAAGSWHTELTGRLRRHRHRRRPRVALAQRRPRRQAGPRRRAARPRRGPRCPARPPPAAVRLREPALPGEPAGRHPVPAGGDGRQRRGDAPPRGGRRGHAGRDRREQHAADGRGGPGAGAGRRRG